MRTIKKKKLSIEKKNIEESIQYKFFIEKILNGHKPDFLYDTGEITVFKYNKSLRAVRKMIKIKYDKVNEQPMILEYFVDAFTKKNQFTSYSSLEKINEKIKLEASHVHSLVEAVNRYFPMDNFMMKTSEIFKNKIDEIMEIGQLGFKVISLNWKVTTVANHNCDIKSKLLEDHIVIHTPFSTNFFWDDIELTPDEIKSLSMEHQNDQDLEKWIKVLNPDEVDSEFKKYFN